MEEKEVTAGTPAGGAAPDAVAEKIGNLEKKFDSSMAALRSIVDSVRPAPPPRAPAPAPVDMGSLLVDDTDKFVEAVVTQATTAAAKVTSKERAKDATLASLVSDFPELRDQSNDFTRRAIEIYNALPPEEQDSPRAYRDSVQQAALEQGIRPAKYRAKSDDFVLPAGGPAPKAPKGADAEFQKTLAIAAAFGKPVNDPKYIESLKRYAKRTDYTRYQTPGEE